MTRGRELGIPFDGNPGPWNAITDVMGIEVGHTTLNAGPGPIHTGVTAILPKGKRYEPVFAGWYSLNGCGELTGTTWLEEAGFLESGIVLTNTGSIGVAHQAVPIWAMQHLHPDFDNMRDVFWFLPVIGETNDSFLNDIRGGGRLREEYVFGALDRALPGPVAEGNVGGGTGMICHEFKGGIGTSSRIVQIDTRQYTVGVLVQANHGEREDLKIAGTPVGKEIPDLLPESEQERHNGAGGSILGIAATDAPLLPHQLKRLARRIPLGLARNGGMGYNSSGDLFVAFSTANEGAARAEGLSHAEFLPNAEMNVLIQATVQAVEEAIVNALIAAETMVGANGNKVYAIPHDRLVAILRKYNRYAG